MVVLHARTPYKLGGQQLRSRVIRVSYPARRSLDGNAPGFKILARTTQTLHRGIVGRPSNDTTSPLLVSTPLEVPLFASELGGFCWSAHTVAARNTLRP